MSTPPPQPRGMEGLARLGRLARKELSESLRDRRTVITLVLMPLLLYPVLAMAFLQMLQYKRVEKEWPIFRVAVASEEEGKAIFSYWQKGEAQRRQRHTPGGKVSEETPLPPFLDPVPELQPLITADVEGAVRQGLVDVGVRLRPPGGFIADPTRLLFVDCELFYREDSNRGFDAVRYLEHLTADANAWQIGRGLRQLGIRQRGDPVRIRAAVLSADTGKRTSLVPVLVPLVLILMTMTGAVYPAIDLTAGERERGTLEILVAAPIPRLSVLLAKYVAVLAVATLTALVNIGAMTITLLATPIGTALFGPALTPWVFLQVLALLLLFAAFFSGVLLAVTSFARSFKEAQAYLIPLMLFCLMPGILALMPGLSLHGPLAVVPLVNIVLLARDLFEGTTSVAGAGVVIVSTLLYAMGAVALAARIFGTEAVLSSDHGTWSDFLRRPEQSRSSAALSTALLCLACMFPASFLLNISISSTQGIDPYARLALGAAANLLLFAGFPLVAAWFSRIHPGSAFRLSAAPLSFWPIALLLGLSLWPFVSELVLLLRQAGFSTLGGEHLERVRAALTEWRALSPLALVAALAILPAVLEELFFRGFLFSAVEETEASPWRVVTATAALFALFHLLVSNALAVERLIPSLLMGLVLGWLAWKSRSVLPGILLHLLHNGALVLLAYYEPQLVERGWSIGPDEHLPGWLLAAAGAGAAIGLLLLWRLQRPAIVERKANT